MSHILGELWLQQTYNPFIPSAEVPQPDITKPSYSISIGPRVSALTSFYDLVKPNGNFQFDHYYQSQNTTQSQMIGFIGRLVRFKPLYIPDFVPFVGIFEYMNEAEEYLESQKITHISGPNGDRGNAMVVVSNLKFKFPIKPIQTTMLTRNTKVNVKALQFNKGYKVLRSQTVYQNLIYQLATTNPRITINISQTYQPLNGTVPNQPVFDFLRFRREQQFYTDITYQYKSIIIPQIDNLLIKEDTKDLNGLYLLRVNYTTNNTNAIQVKNFIQYTRLTINDSEVKEGLHTTNPYIQTTPYAVNTSFMIWIDHLDIAAYPLFIGYINEKNFVLA